MKFPKNEFLNEIGAPDRRWGVALVVVLLLFYAVTFRAGHVWGDDFAHYILQGEKLSRFEGIAPDRYIVNPETSYLAPKVVPPGLSVLLAPVIRVAGVNWTVLKLYLAVFMLAGFYALYLLFRLRLPPFLAAAGLLIVALNPILFDSRDMITPEKPYYLFSFLALYWITRAYAAAPAEAPPMRLAAPLGLLLYAAYATRNLGVGLVAGFGLFDLFRTRRIGRFLITVAAIVGILGLGQSLALRTASGYQSYFQLSPVWILRSAVEFLKSLGYFWSNGYSRLGAMALFAASLGLTAIGAWRLRRTDPCLPYLAVYGLIICAYFAPGYMMYLYPLFPILILYMLVGLDAALARAPRWRTGLAAAFLAAVGLTYAGAYTRLTWGKIPDGIGDPDFQKVVEYIQRKEPAEDVFLFFKPRALALLTGRASAPVPSPLEHPPTPERIWEFAGEIHATHLLTARIVHPDVERTRAAVAEVLRGRADRISVEFESGPFTLYRIAP